MSRKKDSCSGGEPLATLCPIWPVRESNLRLSSPETNALLFAQLVGCRKEWSRNNYINVTATAQITGEDKLKKALDKAREQEVRLKFMKVTNVAKVESRTQGSRPKPRTQKKFEAKDRNAFRTKDTNVSVFLRKKILKNFFRSISKKKTV